MPIVLLTSSHISLFGNGAYCKAGPVPPGLCDNQCHGGERRKYVKTQRKKTRLRPSLYKDYLHPFINVWPNHYYSNTQNSYIIIKGDMRLFEG
ncbi:hypothetical protein BX666DRAFT_2015703 [Dichotomocladium elegans]|nr:hypothetical protein BX666DRAFT_2015703 [Dichotomocladium elegans]